MINFAKLHEYLKDEFKLDWMGIHGISHWSRVYVNARKVAEAERSRDKSIFISDEVLKLFSFLHDHQRINDGSDYFHGSRAIIPARKLRGDVFDISDEEMGLLEKSIIGHSEGLTYDAPTVMVCWDADRLDLGRVGKIPNPKYLCTESAKNNKIIVDAVRRSLF